MSSTRDSYDRFASTFTNLYFETRALDEEMDRFLAYLPAFPLLLDAGSGPGHQAHYFARHGAFAVALDYSEPMLREGQRRAPSLPFVQGDLLALPFPSHTLDGVWARASLIHLNAEEHRRSLSEIHRVLKPHGVMYAAVRQGVGDEVRRETQKGVRLKRYFRFWSSEDWHAQIEAHGFIILSSGVEEGSPEDWLWVYARRHGR